MPKIYYNGEGPKVDSKEDSKEDSSVVSRHSSLAKLYPLSGYNLTFIAS